MLTSADLTEWQSYAALEPFGEWAADRRTAAAIAARFELHRDKNKAPEPFRLEQYLHYLDSAPPEWFERRAAGVHASASRDPDADLAEFDRVFNVKG